jgi:hypothetical protein
MEQVPRSPDPQGYCDIMGELNLEDSVEDFGGPSKQMPLPPANFFLDNLPVRRGQVGVLGRVRGAQTRGTLSHCGFFF